MSGEKMSQEKWSAVDTYFSDLFIPPDPALDAALAASDSAGLPKMNVAPNQGKLLMLLAQIQGARRILEIGTLGGYSTIWLARALPPEGRLITLEYEAKHADVAQENIARAGLSEMVEIRVGRAVEHLAQMAANGEGPFDLIFIDADKPSNPDYFAWALKLARPGSVIILDNVVRDGAVINAHSQDASILGTRRVSEMLAAETRVSVTAIQTVGSKGYDGFALIRVMG
jgi:predicted O-methyltransferase YrrM